MSTASPRPGYTVQGSVIAVIGYRADVDARSNLRSFRLIEDSAAPYRLRVVNGDRFGKHRVTGATIQVNEVPVLEPRDLSDAMAVRLGDHPAAGGPEPRDGDR